MTAAFLIALLLAAGLELDLLAIERANRPPAKKRRGRK